MVSWMLDWVTVGSMAPGVVSGLGKSAANVNRETVSRERASRDLDSIFVLF